MSEGGRKHQHVEPSQIAGGDLPAWMRDDKHRKLILTGILLLALVTWACIGYGVATVIGWITSAPAFLLSLVDMVVKAR